MPAWTSAIDRSGSISDPAERTPSPKAVVRLQARGRWRVGIHWRKDQRNRTSLPSATARALRSTSDSATPVARQEGQRDAQTAQVDGEVLAGDGCHDEVIRSKCYTTERGRRPILP